MRHTRHILFSALLLSLFSIQVCYAQGIDVDPRHPDWVEFPRTAYWWNDSLVRGEIIRASFFGAWGLGDIDNSGTDDFAVGVSLAKKDSSGAEQGNNELWVYKGVRGSMPDIRAYQRVGPTEFASDTRFLASGDWDGDGDGDIDICTNIKITGDTSNGTVVGINTVSRVVVFWNDGTGVFSLADTTRLPNPVGLGNDVWGGNYGRSSDLSGDGVEDLLIQGGGGRVNGESVRTPRLHLFHGVRGGQWGRKGVSAKPVWGWWNIPTHQRMSVIDQNCDGRPDLIFYNDRPWPDEGDLTILYGAEDSSLPDTLDVEQFSFDTLCGETTVALLEDLTSDHIPDLVLTCHDWLWRIYAGQPGKRLSQVYGSGNDPADPENGFPDARPWAKVEMPGLLRDGSFSSPYEGPLFELGDADLDGWNDLWTTWSTVEDGPNVVVYRAGPGFDMIIDGHAYYGGELRHVGLLGDIDGTGNPMRVIINGYFDQHAIQFFKSVDTLPTHAYDYPRKPPSGHKTFEPTGNRCDGSIGAVSNDEFQATSLNVQVVPNPSNGEVRIVWESEKRRKGEAEITVHDLSGATVLQTKAGTAENTFLWNAAGLPSGVYYVTITIGGQQQTVSAVHLSAGCC